MNNITQDVQDDLIDGDFTLYNEYNGNFRGPAVYLELIEFLRVVFVFGLRIGYLLIQLGSIPVENAYVIIYHNIIEIAVASISFGTIGIFISYGFETEKYYDYWQDWDIFVASRIAIGSCAVLTGTAQMSSYLVGRIHPAGAIILTILYSAFYQPLLMYMVFTRSSLMEHLNVQMRDPGFTLVAYIPSSIVGLVGSMFMGRRVVRLKDVDEFSIGNDHVTATMAGYLLIIMGYTFLGIPVKNDGIDFDPKINVMAERVVIINLLALSMGIIVVNTLYYIAYRDIYKYWVLLRCLQGGIAGMMTVSAATDFAGLWNVFAMSALGATLYFFMTLFLHNTALEDWCNMTSSHLVCGFLGAIIWPLFEGLFDIKILWQVVYTITVVAVTTIFALIVFLILNAAGILKNKYERVNHVRARNILSHLPNKKYLERLFMINDNKTPHIVPGSSRRRYIPDDEGINLRDGPKPLTFENDGAKDASKKKENKTEPMENTMFFRDDKKLAFPVSTPTPIRSWLTAGSGDYYGAMI